MTVTIHCHECEAGTEVEVACLHRATKARWGYAGGEPACDAEYEVTGLGDCACGEPLDTEYHHALAIATALCDAREAML